MNMKIMQISAPNNNKNNKEWHSFCGKRPEEAQQRERGTGGHSSHKSSYDIFLASFCLLSSLFQHRTHRWGRSIRPLLFAYCGASIAGVAEILLSHELLPVHLLLVNFSLSSKASSPSAKNSGVSLRSHTSTHPIRPTCGESEKWQFLRVIDAQDTNCSCFSS